MFDDLAFFVKVSIEGPVFVASTCWHKYRRHPDSFTSRVVRAGRYQASWTAFVEWLALYVWEHGIRRGEVWRLLRRELGPYPHPALYPAIRPAWRLAVKGKKTIRLAAGKIAAAWRRHAGAGPAVSLGTLADHGEMHR